MRNDYPHAPCRAACGRRVSIAGARVVLRPIANILLCDETVSSALDEVGPPERPAARGIRPAGQGKNGKTAGIHHPFDQPKALEIGDRIVVLETPREDCLRRQALTAAPVRERTRSLFRSRIG